MHPRSSDGPGPVWPPRPVSAVTDTFLALADEAAPGLVEGLYLHGSLGFGEWYDGRSDIDYVAVLADRPDARTVALLRDVHQRLTETFPRPPYDGLHLTWADLAREPYACPDVPCTQHGIFTEHGRLDLHPVTWHELADHGVRVRGPELGEVPIWTDRQVLRDYTRSNLEQYWAPRAAQLRRFPDEAGHPVEVTWTVLGITRLHHLLATGELTSKTGAGRYALHAFEDRWRPVVEEALALRETGMSSGVYDDEPDRRAADTIGFTEMVLADAAALS